MINNDIIDDVMEALLFVSGSGLAISDIKQQLEVSDKDLNACIDRLGKKYGGKCGIRLLRYNNKLQLASNPDYSDIISCVLNPIKERELSNAAMETMAIVAYRQPVTRLEIEQIRGVNCEYTVQMLLKHDLIEVVGRKDGVGKPLLFGTTDNFLKRFQIASLDELPDYDDLMSKIKLIHGGDDTYLFRKDVYDAQNDPDYLARQQEADAIAAGQMPGASATAATETVTGESAESKEEEKTFDYSTIGVSDNGAEGGQEDLFADRENEKDGEEEDELKPVDEEDIPDFLKDEKIERIG